MRRMAGCALIAFATMTGIASAAPTGPTAPEKMGSPADKQKMEACKARAAARNVPVDERAKFIMACMMEK